MLLASVCDARICFLTKFEMRSAQAVCQPPRSGWAGTTTAEIWSAGTDAASFVGWAMDLVDVAYLLVCLFLDGLAGDCSVDGIDVVGFF